MLKAELMQKQRFCQLFLAIQIMQEVVVQVVKLAVQEGIASSLFKELADNLQLKSLPTFFMK